MKSNRLAAIDIGSTSVGFLIMDVINYKGRIHYQNSSFMRFPLQLKQDILTSGVISEQKKEKLKVLIKTLASLMRVNKVEDQIVCATSALQKIKNKQEVIDYLYEKTQIKIDISTPQEESLYILNCCKDPMEDDKTYILADVDKHSTEISLSCKGKALVTKTFDLGTMYPNTDEETEEWDNLKKWIKQQHTGNEGLSLIVSGVNIRKLNPLFHKGSKISYNELDSYYNKIKNISYEKRIMNPSLKPSRAESIIPAIEIYLQIMNTLKIEEINIPDTSIADGLIKELYQRRYL